MASWSGKSKGGKLGYAIFIFILKYAGLRLTYFFVRFVAFFYLLFSDKKGIYQYFHEILGYPGARALRSIYRNYYLLGQVLIDKIAVLAGFKARFTYDFTDEPHLHAMVEGGKGGLLIGAHMGNWEIAGQLLVRLKTSVNIVMYDAEHQAIKELLEGTFQGRTANIIPIKEDFSHLFKIQEAFNRNELVVMHGDRFLPGTSHSNIEFLGSTAAFPTGPLYMASKFQVPVSFVYAFKERATHYQFYASEPKIYPFPSRLKTRKQELQAMVQEYVSSLEEMVAKYPLQWFNYYLFWGDQSGEVL